MQGRRALKECKSKNIIQTSMRTTIILLLLGASIAAPLDNTLQKRSPLHVSAPFVNVDLPDVPGRGRLLNKITGGGGGGGGINVNTPGGSVTVGEQGTWLGNLFRALGLNINV